MLKRLTVLFIFAAVLGHCNKNWISSQDNPRLGAITMYFSIKHGLTKAASVKNLSTGEVYSNGSYGWGKEFFPIHKRYDFMAIGNLPPGSYSLHSLYFWAVDARTQEQGKQTIQIPDDVFVFAVMPGEILYLGEPHLEAYLGDVSENTLSAYVKLKQRQGLSVRSFSVPHPRDESQALRVVYSNPLEPTESNRRSLRKGEKAFLEFFISRRSDLPAWADIAERRLQLPAAD